MSPDERAIIANLEYLSTQAGADLPHLIWLHVAPATDRATLADAITGMGITVGSPQDAQALLNAEQARMERVGFFGTLSIGFLAATTMATLALLVHSYAALQEQLYQLGVLRAIGLSQRAVLGQIGVEYAVLTLFGSGAGAWIGLVAAQLFAPYFRIPGSDGAPPPPLIPLVQPAATLQYALGFALIMVLAETLLLVYALSRQRFSALRIGHHG